MKKHILIVEDEQSLALAYQTILEKNGYEAKIAYDGQEALESIGKGRYDLILLDMNMPKMNGLELLRQLDAAKLDARVVIFSNQDNQSDIDEAFKLGAKRYLLKSWASPQDLVKVVAENLG